MLTQVEYRVSETPLSLDERRAILQRTITTYARRGFRISPQTETVVRMVKPKAFDLALAIDGLRLFGIGLVIYLMYYLAQQDQILELFVDDHGRVPALDGR